MRWSMSREAGSTGLPALAPGLAPGLDFAGDLRADLRGVVPLVAPLVIPPPHPCWKSSRPSRSKFSSFALVTSGRRLR